MSQIEPDPATVPLPDRSPPTNPAPLPDPNSEVIAENYGQKDVDLLDRIKGMYRLLYVYKEAATSGLVDKIIIDQESLGKLMNTIIPRSYSSLSKINFGALDETSIQPVGIYGSKSQIVRLLQHLNCVDQETADHLLQDRNEHVIHQPWLQSGIYYLNPNIGSTETAGLVSYIIYWPDDTTWDDGAEDAVRRTRTTFMRYLSRLVGQTFALISPEHASKLVSMGDHKSLEGTKSQEDKVIEQRNDEDNNSDDSDNDNDNDFSRIINFKVLKTQHEEEGLTVSQGFSITHQAIKSQDPHSSSVPLEGESQQAPRIPTSPRIITGECCFGFLSIEYRPPGQESRPPPDSEKSRMMLDHESSHHKNIFLAPDLSHSGIEALIGLNSVKKRAGKIIQDYQNELQRIDDRKTASVASSLASIEAGLQKEVNTLRAGCRSIVVSKLVEIYPTLDVSKCSAADIDMDDTHKAYLQSLQDANVGLSDIQSLVLSRANLSQVPSHKFKAAKSKYPRLIQHLKLVADPAPLIREFIENKDTGNQASTAWSKLSSGLRFLSFMNKRPGLSPGESASSGGKVPETSDSDFIASIVAIPDDDVTSPVKEHILNLFYEGIDKHIENVTEELVSEYQKSIKEEQVGLVQAQAENQGQMDISKAHELFLNKLRVALAPTSATRAGITFESIEPIDHRPNYYRFLERGAKCLVVIEEPGEVAIFVVNMATIAQLPSSAPLRRLKKSGNRHFIIAVDERRHLLAVTTTTESGVFLQMYAFDKAFSNLHARGSPLDITGYYNDGLPSFHSTHFTGEAEELCLVEESGRIRVFSFISQTFRPAIVNIDSFVSVFPSTEGAALLVLKRSEGGYGLRSFHWESFGHNPEGILADLGDDADLASCSSWGVASFRNHSFPLLLALDGDRHVIKSFRLQISRKDTVFSLRSKNRSSKDIGKSATSNNSLIDCHATVWSKYPIVPAIKTEAFAPKVQCPTSLSFVTDASESFSFPSYFKSLVKDFEYKTRKPTDGRLEAIEIRALSFNDVDWRKHSQANVYTTGEWMAGLLCLIPIQIAVARENRFIPLKDGVLDTATEQSLLGAEIGDIIDAISIGWYESIFNSYMAEKPVKVISSLGEQSVGKSYALNHMVDSSFAGSAYRTTEGVWLSVCPTKDMLIVAVDFEGVHSIERSPQEDMLLVLFNTALSNMVLFRNNFAFSRDIANMFTSFQSSTSLLDPAANPKLFNVLHASRLSVVPWPVIQSPEFYSLFGKMRTRLMKQRVTHSSAGEFLLTLKTLMAKLKAQDWASIDQNLTKHRVSSLLQILPTAIAYGVSELSPDIEELKASPP
ncbi:hypothetical protein FRC02_008585 [Tulasnella sp. 418]|nr:hypothetical protein FRC02_008585 [Tulasnella sp. 418]